jgi:flagellar FliL protein
MSAAAPTADAAAEGSAPPKGKKKLIVILAAVLALAGVGGGATVYVMKKKAAEAAAAAAAEDGDDDAEDAAPAHAEAKKDHAHPPTFVPLDPFVVNLADKDVDRFAQIGVTLEVEDAKTGEQLKAYMPAIRNGVLMVLSHKTSQELLQREGKELLAREILRESMLPLGVDISESTEGSKKKKKKEKEADEVQPVKNVYFSNFIVQ